MILLAQALRHEVADAAKDGLRAGEGVELTRTSTQMPRKDGLETLARLRARDPERRSFLTARDAVADRAGGCAGADDYDGPSTWTRWLPAWEALLRCAGRTQQTVSAVLQVADLTLDVDSMTCVAAGKRSLTNTEFELLRYLMEMLEFSYRSRRSWMPWSYDFGAAERRRTLHFLYLRKKIDADRPALIRTVRRCRHPRYPSDGVLPGRRLSRAAASRSRHCHGGGVHAGRALLDAGHYGPELHRLLAAPVSAWTSRMRRTTRYDSNEESDDDSDDDGARTTLQSRRSSPRRAASSQAEGTRARRRRQASPRAPGT